MRFRSESGIASENPPAMSVNIYFYEPYDSDSIRPARKNNLRTNKIFPEKASSLLISLFLC